MALWDDLKAYYQCSSTADSWGEYNATFNSVSVGSGTGKFGDSWEFASTAAYVSLGTTIPLTSSGWTVMAWGYNLRPDSAFRTLFYNGTAGVNGSMHFITQNTTALAGVYSNSTFVSSGTALAAASYTGWHHYASTFNGSVVSLYVDGVLIGTVTPTWPGGHQVAQIGGDTYGEGFAERLDDVAAWGRQLTATEITTIYDAGTNGQPLANLIPSRDIWQDLFSYWDFDGNLVDRWGGYSGTGSGSGAIAYPASMTGFGQCLDLTPNSYSNIGSVSQWGAGSFSISCWVNSDVNPSGAYYTVFAADNASSVGFALFTHPGTSGRLRFEIGTDGVNWRNIYSTNPLSSGTWYHVVVVVDRATNSGQMYIDGVLQSNASDTGTAAGSLSVVGTIPTKANYWGASDNVALTYWSGKIDDGAMWDRALTSAEVSAIYNAGNAGNPLSSLIGIEAELRSYYEAASVYDSWNVIDLTMGSEVNVISSGDHFSAYYDKWHFGFGTNNANSYLRKVGGIPVAAANNMTFSCWAKDIVATGDKNLVTFANGEVLIYVDNASNELGVYDGAFYSSGVSFPYGAGWRHIAATYDHTSGVTTFYIDGAPVGTVTRTLSFVGLEYIGGLQGSARQFAAGLDDIVVWERKLGDSEISTVYDASKSGFSPFYKLIPGRQINDNNDEIGWLSTPLTNTFNKLNYHFNTVTSQNASSSYSQDFESTAIGSLPTGWTTFGDQNWEVTGSDAHAGTKSAGSNPALNDNQSTSIAYTASLGSPQTLTFWWKVSSEGSFDWLTFYIDGVQQDRISGTPAWAEKSYSLPSGSSILKWTYAKDGSATSGQDAAWIDDINIGAPAGVFTPDGSGNGHDATLTGISVADTGSYITLYSGSTSGGDATKFESSLNFDGTTSKVDTGVTPNDVGIVSSNEKSIMFWASSSAWVDYKPFFSMGTNSTRQDFTLIQKTDGDIQLNVWGDDLTFTPSSTSGWHHYACTYDNGSNVIYVYIDGQLAGSKTLAGALNTSDANNILIGAGAHYWASHFFSGSIQEFSLFSSELSAQNILDVYNHQFPKIVGGAGTITSATNMWGSMLHDAPPNYAVALNMWGSTVHDAPPNYAVATNMWGSMVHGGAAPQTASVANMWGSVLHDAPPDYAVAVNMWGSMLHDAPPEYAVAVNMFGTLVHSGTTVAPTGGLPIISASTPSGSLIQEIEIGYTYNTYTLLSSQRRRTVEQVPFKLSGKGIQSLRLRPNTDFTGSS